MDRSDFPNVKTILEGIFLFDEFLRFSFIACDPFVQRLRRIDDEIQSLPFRVNERIFLLSLFEICLKLERGGGGDHSNGFHVEIVRRKFVSTNKSPSDRNQHNRRRFSGSGQTDARVAQVERISSNIFP